MKNFALLILVSLLPFLLSSQSYIDKKGHSHLWGTVIPDSLEQAPHSEWYLKNYADHSSSLNTEDSKMLEDISVKIFIGTWCGDTKYLLPKFMKTWHQMGLSNDQLDIIAVHHESELYKQGPNNETEGYNIHRVPTFIFEKDGKEINRIVERTVFDIETDMKLIASGAPYQARYKASALVSEALDILSLDSLHSDQVLKKVQKSIVRELSLESELNTYAYVLFYSGEVEKAEFVFKLNKELFPYDPYVIHGYGKVLMENGKHKEAKEQLQETLRIELDNAKAISYLFDINKKLSAALTTE